MGTDAMKITINDRELTASQAQILFLAVEIILAEGNDGSLLERLPSGDPLGDQLLDVYLSRLTEVRALMVGLELP